MRPSIALQRHREEIRAIVLHNRCYNPRVFGSVLHNEDTEDSDLDLLVEPTAKTSLFDIAGIHIELEKLLGCRVDVLTLGDISTRFRARVEAEAVPV